MIKERRKICSNCNKELPLTTEYFHRSKVGKYGFTSNCKDCRKEYALKNKDLLRKLNKKWRKNNPDKIKEYQKTYLSKPDKKEMRKVLQHSWYIKNKEKILEKHRDWAHTDKGKLSIINSAKKYNKTLPGRENIRKRRAKHKNKGYKEITENIFDSSEKLHWHHIYKDKEDVIALPIDLHNIYPGASKYHFIGCYYIISQVYNI